MRHACHLRPVAVLPGRPGQVDATEQGLDRPSPTPASIKRKTLAGLYRTDPRVGAWAGTAHGVLQASQQPPAAPKLPLPLAG